MEKQTKHKNNILRFIPKALSFNNPTFSPSRDKEVNATRPGGRGFSGPIVSIIPKEARRKTKGEMVDTQQEPTSPKVSCLGQIKQRHKKEMMIKKEKDAKRSRLPSKEAAEKKERMLFGGSKSGAAEAKAPALGQMRRFESSRSSLSNFDWTAQVVPEDSDRRRNCHSEEDMDREEDEVSIPFSAPREMQLQPKKEINLWKRRTMSRPLTLDS